jgi:5-methyltetrahydropteroyltriglutamate--homocysteine methyltransferase
LRAPRGLGLVEEHRRVRQLTDAPLKVPVPGPFTLAGCIQGGEVYRDRRAVTEALLPIVNAEMKALVAEGATFLQLDEPSFACRPDQPEEFLDIIARTVQGVKAFVSMHLCFGNYRGRAVGQRSYRPLFPHLARAKVDQLALEFASREMAEIELAREIKPPMGLAVGLVDVKNSWVEPQELVSERLRMVLKHIEPERVHITPDCGFSQTARFIAVEKLKNMVAGVRLVRAQLAPRH